ncbi:UNVERIFIED_CONTAM: hypothetical protein K2H54_074773 [Gekko kuhli]
METAALKRSYIMSSLGISVLPEFLDPGEPGSIDRKGEREEPGILELPGVLPPQLKPTFAAKVGKNYPEPSQSMVFHNVTINE